MRKLYTIEMNEDSKGFLKTSFVSSPAIESGLIFLKEETDDILKFQDEEKGIIYAPSMIPNKKIFRKNINGEPADIYFTKEAILKMHLKGCKNNYDQKINLNHDQTSTIPDVYCFENWIIEDKIHDKSVKLGLDLPVGTLIKGYKIDNEQIKQDIKDGKITGLSVEFMPDVVVEEQKQVNFKTEINMNKKGAFALAIEKLKEIFESEDDKEKDLPIVEEDKEEVKEEELAEEEPTEEPAKEEESDLQAELTAALTKIADLEAQIAAYESTKMANEEAEVKLKADFDALKLSSEVMETELMEFKKIPSIPVEESVPYEKMTNAQKTKYNRENKK